MTKVVSSTGVPPATKGEVSPVEIRALDGGLVRRLHPSKAEELVRYGFGEWRRAANGRRYVILYQSFGGGRSRGWLSRNDGTTTKERVWRNGEAISAPVIHRHLNSKY